VYYLFIFSHRLDFTNDPVNASNVAAWAQKLYNLVDVCATRAKENKSFENGDFEHRRKKESSSRRVECGVRRVECGVWRADVQVRVRRFIDM
jgi:hypothetical protein